MAFKTLWGHQYVVGIICPPPLDWNRVKVAPKTGWGPVPMSPCSQARLTFIYLNYNQYELYCLKNSNVESYSNVSSQFIIMQMSCLFLKETYFCFRVILKKFFELDYPYLVFKKHSGHVKSVWSLDHSDQPQGFQVSPVWALLKQWILYRNDTPLLSS